MPDWWNVAIPVFTYIGGILTKPIQNVIEEKRDAAKIRRMLYTELAGNCELLVRLRYWLSDTKEESVDLSLATNAHIHANGYEDALKQPRLFYLLEEAPDFIAMYSSLALLKTAGERPKTELAISIGSLFDGLRERTQDGKLDKGVFFATLNPEMRAEIEALMFRHRSKTQ